MCGKCKAALTTNRQPPAANRHPATLTDALAQERGDVRFGKPNVDGNPHTAAAFGVQGIPLPVFLRGGNEAGRVVGAVPKGQIEAAIQRYLVG